MNFTFLRHVANLRFEYKFELRVAIEELTGGEGENTMKGVCERLCIGRITVNMPLSKYFIKIICIIALIELDFNTLRNGRRGYIIVCVQEKEKMVTWQT